MRVFDQLHRVLEIPNTPCRIISLVPSQTELLVDLGLEKSLVGITKFCVHPKHLKKQIQIVGGTKTVHINKIKALRPDIIICNKEENTKEIVADLTKIAPVWVSDIYTLSDVVDMIKRLGDLFEVSKVASSLIGNLKLAQEDFETYIKGRPSRRVAYLIWKKPFMVASSNTFIDAMLHLNKFVNIFESHPGRYPEIRLEEMQSLDLILLSSEPYPFKEADVLELKNALQKEVRLVDGEFFSWYGSRLIAAFEYFKSLHL